MSSLTLEVIMANAVVEQIRRSPGRSSSSTIEFYDVWTDRITHVTVGETAGELAAELRTTTCAETEPTATISFRWSRPGAGTENGQMTFAITDADAFVTLVAKVVDQARRDGTLPA
jgi:hypothetical protein